MFYSFTDSPFSNVSLISNFNLMALEYIPKYIRKSLGIRVRDKEPLLIKNKDEDLEVETQGSKGSDEYYDTEPTRLTGIITKSFSNERSKLLKLSEKENHHENALACSTKRIGTNLIKGIENVTHELSEIERSETRNTKKSTFVEIFSFRANIDLLYKPNTMIKFNEANDLEVVNCIY